MPDKNKKTKKTEQQNPLPDELDNNANDEKATGSPQGFFSAIIEIFKHLFPALKEAFAAGTKTFKKRVQGITTPEQSDEQKEPRKGDRPGVDEPEDKDAENLPPQQQVGLFKSKLSAASKKQKFLIVFLIFLIIIIPVWGGLYLGGMFDEEDAAGVGSDKSVSAAQQEDTRKGGLFDAIFGKKDKTPPTPAEQLAAMHINRNPNNFVRYAGQNNIAVVQLFIQSGMHPDTRRTIDGFAPLTAAAVFGRPEMAEFLLDENGADINVKDNDGQTALMKAVRHNRPEMVEMLLARNADYSIADRKGNTALSLAKEHYGDNPLTKAFEKFGVDISDAKKEPVKNEQPSPTAPEPEAVTSPAQPAPPAQPRQSRYLEISVEEFLKFLQSEPNQ